MEEPAPSPVEEETANRSSAGAVEAPVTSSNSVPTDRKKKWQHTYRLFEMSSLKEDAMCYDI
jgi:hypothetical protein